MDDNVQKAETELQGLYKRLFVDDLTRELKAIRTAVIIEEAQESLAQQVDQINAGRNKVKEIKNILNEHGEQLDAINQHSESLPNKFEIVKNSVDGLNVRIGNLMSAHQSHMEATTADYAALANKVTDISNCVDTLLDRPVASSQDVALLLKSGTLAAAEKTGKDINNLVIEEAAKIRSNLADRLRPDIEGMRDSIKADLDRLSEKLQSLSDGNQAVYEGKIKAVKDEVLADVERRTAATVRSHRVLLWLGAAVLALQVAQVSYGLLAK